MKMSQILDVHYILNCFEILSKRASNLVGCSLSIPKHYIKLCNRLAVAVQCAI